MRIIFIGGYRFPAGDAAAIRTLSLARICRDLGYQVTVIGKGVPVPEHYDAAAGDHVIEGIRYLTMNPRPVTWRDRLRHPLHRLTLYKRTLHAIGLNDVRAVIVYATNSGTHMPSLETLCRRDGVPLIADLTEWYGPRRFRWGFLDPAYLAFLWCVHQVLPRMRNLIVISTLLEQRFSNRVTHVIRVPPVIDTQRISAVDETVDDRLVLLYAGMAGRKDHLIEVCEALARLDPAERDQIEVRVVGTVPPDVARSCGASVRMIGHLAHKDVLDHLRQAHFTLLLRPDDPQANAGFPSKVPESLAAGTPVLLTYTSDLKAFLGDGTASIEVGACTAEAVQAVLTRILSLDRSQWSALRSGARAKAEQHFDYRLYLSAMRTFLDQVE